MQIYMENIIDLLDESRNPRRKDFLQVREDPKNGVYVDGLTQISVSNINEVISLIRDGVKNRLTYATTMVIQK